MGGLSAYRSNNGFADSLATVWLGGDPYDMDSVHMLHPDQHAFAFLPSDPDVFFAACDGGIQRTDNVMADEIYWNRRNFGLFSSQFYTVSVDVKGEGDDFILGGLQDNCWYYSPTDNPAEWWFSVDLHYDGFSCKLADHHDYAVVSAYSGNLPVGTYLLQVQINDKKKSRKLSKLLQCHKFLFRASVLRYHRQHFRRLSAA